MALGLLGAALAGGGQAVQQNAVDKLKRLHDEGILKMRQEFASSERVAGQQFSREERVAGQKFTSGENQVNRQHDLTLTQMREAGADRRSAASRQQQPQWQMVPDGNGGYIQYDPVTNSYREANLPEGVSFGGSELTERERLTIETLADERKSIMESSMGQPNDQQAARLGEIDSRMEQLLGGGATTGGGDLATRLAQQLGIDPNDAPEQQADTPSNPPPAGGGAPPPRPSTAEGYVGARQEADTAKQTDREADDAIQELSAEARRIAGRITIPDQFSGGFQRGGLINGATQRGIDTEAEREAAQVVLERVSAAYNQESDPQRKAMLQRALDALYEAGVTR